MGEGCSIDASKRTGVEQVRVASLLEKYEVCYVMRWEGTSDEDLDKVVTCAEGYLGFRYAKLDALLLPIRRYALKRHFSVRGQSYITKSLNLSFRIRKFLPSMNAIYCSQMVVEVYSKIGLFGKINVDQGAFSPNDLISQNCFTYMGYISNKTSPNFHSHDILAPILRYQTRRWSIF